jgi:RND superfamily putative drug exporter
VRTGLARAAEGAGLHAEGSGNAEAGAQQIAGGLGEAIDGSQEAVAGIGKIDSGAGEIANRSEELVDGQESVKPEVKAQVERFYGLARELRSQALSRNSKLTAELKGLKATNPELAKAVERSEELGSYLRNIRENAQSNGQSARSLNENQSELLKGSRELQGGSEKLHQGTSELNDEAPSLPTGLEELQSGQFRLADGINELQGGSQELQSNLASGYDRTGKLEVGLRRTSVKVTRGAGSMTRKVDRINNQSPGLFDSGYFVLSAIDGAPPAEREKAGEAISIKNGGQGAAITVISRYTFNTDGSTNLDHRLKEDAKALAKDADVEAGVAGGAAQLTDYDAITKERIPWVVIAITLVTLLVMIVIVRAPLLAALAVLLNLATVGVAFGIIVLLFNVPHGYPGGGHTYVDAIGAGAMFGVVFGLSIDYAVFLLMRMKENYDRTGDNSAAISEGLEKTARLITGAAAIMMAVFIAFAGASIATVSQLGIGLTVAVLLDATVVRIVLLPALMLIIGEKVWWLPKWLDRAMPRLNV